MSKGASQKKSNKIYNSFPSEQQQEILKHFHKFFPSHERPEAPNKIDTKEFNQFLKKYIPYYVNFFKFSFILI